MHISIVYLLRRSIERNTTLVRLAPSPLNAGSLGRGAECVIRSALANPHVRLAGVCCEVGTTDTNPFAVERSVREVIGQLDLIRREHRCTLTKLVIELEANGEVTPAAIQEFTWAVENGLDDGCARFRFPRPSFTLALRPAAIAG